MVKKTDPRLIFLRARLSEIESHAMDAQAMGKIMTKYDDAEMTTELTWQWGLLAESVHNGRRGAGYSTSYHEGAPSPEAVLADVDSKRQILDIIEPYVRTGDRTMGGHAALSILSWLLRPFRSDPAFDEGWLA